MHTRPARMLAVFALAVACGGKTVVGSTDAAIDSATDTSVSDTGVPDTLLPDLGPPPDTGTPLSSACAAAGGAVCSPSRWQLCPKGYEPIAAADAHLGCGAMGGWCCVLAPPSTCSSSGRGNCIPGECTGCWSAVAGLACESGRSCCEDMCD